MVQPLNYLKETASQTAGPYLHIGLSPRAAGFNLKGLQLGDVIAGPDAPGDRINVEGVVKDGTGAAVKDVLIEIWHADAAGQYHEQTDPKTGFRGWGRCVPALDDGVFKFQTIKPGRVDVPSGGQMAPHICLWLVARGINTGLHTRLYFADEPDANAKDPVLNLIEQTHRKNTLIAEPTETGYRFDVVLQGTDETVFFDV